MFQDLWTGNLLQEWWEFLSRRASYYYDVYWNASWIEFPYIKLLGLIVLTSVVAKILMRVLFGTEGRGTAESDPNVNEIRDNATQGIDEFTSGSNDKGRQGSISSPDDPEYTLRSPNKSVTATSSHGKDSNEEWDQGKINDKIGNGESIFDVVSALERRSVEECRDILEKRSELWLHMPGKHDLTFPLKYQIILLFGSVVNRCKDIVENRDNPSILDYHLDANNLLSTGQLRKERVKDYQKWDDDLKVRKGIPIFSMGISQNKDLILNVRDEYSVSRENIDLTSHQLNYIKNVFTILYNDVFTEGNASHELTFLRSMLDEIRGRISQSEVKLTEVPDSNNISDTGGNDELKISGNNTGNEVSDNHKHNLSPLREHTEDSITPKGNPFQFGTYSSNSLTKSSPSDSRLSGVKSLSLGTTERIHNSQSQSSESNLVQPFPEIFTHYSNSNSSNVGIPDLPGQENSTNQEESQFQE